MFLSLSLSHLTTRDDAWWSSESNLTFTRNQHICKKEFIWFNRNCISHFDFFRSRLNSSSIDALLVAVHCSVIMVFEFKIFFCSKNLSVTLPAKSASKAMILCDSITKFTFVSRLFRGKKSFESKLDVWIFHLNYYFALHWTAPNASLLIAKYSRISRRSTSDSFPLFCSI